MEQREILLKKLQEETEIPEIVYQKAEQAFDRIRTDTGWETSKGRKRKARFSKKKYALFILAAVLAIGTLSVSAATYFHWNDTFKEEHKVTPEVEKKLNATTTAKEMNQFTEHDGIRIEAVQSVADNTAALIVLKILGTEEFPLRTRMNFRNVEVTSESMDTPLSMATDLLNSEASDAQPDDVWNDGWTYELLLIKNDEGDSLLA